MTDKPVETPAETPLETVREAEGERLEEGESFGAWLRQQREMREIHLREISDRTKISLRYLRAMEEDRFGLLPGPIFVKGFLREYAKYVGLNPDEVVNFYLSTRSEPEEPEEPEPPVRPWGRRLMAIVVVALVLAVVAFLVAYWADRRQERAEHTPPPYGVPVTLPEPVPEDPPAESEEPAAARAPLRVTLDFSQDCWVEAVVDGGAERVAQRFVQGEALTLEAEESVTLETLGDGAAVSLQVNGRPYPLRAREGEVVRDLRITLGDLEGGDRGEGDLGGADRSGAGGGGDGEREGANGLERR